MSTLRVHTSEAGATAVLVAITMFVLMGFVALVVDVGAGFNERRQDQAAADAGIMAGAVEAIQNPSQTGNDDVVVEVLDYVRRNLETVYTDAEWQAMWQACSDPDRGPSYLPQPDPWTAGATLDCVSRSSGRIRVWIPDQTVDTTFARVLGFNQITTNAYAEALIGAGDDYKPLLPYGIAGDAGTGELCFGSAPGGIAFPPCSGPSSGTFGTLLSEFFGTFYGTPDCGNPGATEVETTTALGVDHPIGTWDAQGSASIPSPGSADAHPGDAAVLGYSGTNRDACDLTSGEAVAVDGVPHNTVRVDTGFPGPEIEAGLVSNNTYVDADGDGAPDKSRLQQGSNPKRTVVASRIGSSEELWRLDNWGPWLYLNGTGTCAASSYTGLSTDQKLARFDDCIANHSGVVFSETILDSPRLGWAPQYWYQLPTTGLSWEPIYDYRVVFIGGVWFNCSAGACEATFYPDEEVTDASDGEICVTFGGGCKALNLNQFSAWYLPETMLPTAVLNSFPGGSTPYSPELAK